MSPKQAVGRPVDRRSDIFSFGAVLYEMLAGNRAFTGAATPDVLEAMVKNDPDWSRLPPGGVDKLIRRCLTKDRKQRLQAIGEARITLSNPVGQVPDPPAKSSKLLWATAALAITTAVAMWAPWRAEKPVDRPLVRRGRRGDVGAQTTLYRLRELSKIHFYGLTGSPNGPGPFHFHRRRTPEYRHREPEVECNLW